MSELDIAEIQKTNKKRWLVYIAVLAILLFFSSVVALRAGYANISLTDVIKILFLGDGNDTERWIVIDYRLPRIVLAAIVGAALALAGAAMQGIFRNSMASPSVLGISNGAAFGASLSMVFGISIISGQFSTSAMAFIFAFISLLLVYSISRTRNGYVPVETLLLAGIAVGALFSALISAMQYFAGDQLSGIVFWLMGSLNTPSWSKVSIAFLPILIGSVLILGLSRELNAMTVGEEQASNLGINVNRSRLLLLLAASLITAMAVSMTGTIGFVGLIVPHIMRMFVGPDHRILLPASILGGAIFLILADTVARIIISPAEMPVGIITSAIGAPFFIYLLISRKKSMGW